MSLPRAVAEWLIFGERGVRRFTQDSPVLPDVWLRLAEEPDEPLELILTPYRDTKSGDLAVTLRDRLEKDPQGRNQEAARISYIQGNVAVNLTFAEAVRVVLPMTRWWDDRVYPGWTGWKVKPGKTLQITPEENRWMIDNLVAQLANLDKEDAEIKAGDRRYPLLHAAEKQPAADETKETKETKGKGYRSPKDFQWMVRLVGWIALGRSRKLPELAKLTVEEWRAKVGRSARKPLNRRLVEATLALIAGFNPGAAAQIFQVNRNRSVFFAVRDSRLAVKADAAKQLFSVCCDRLAWVVIDGGIDATHRAFRLRDKSTGKPYDEPFEKRESPEAVAKPAFDNRTRVVATYDFSGIRDLVNPTGLEPEALPKHLQEVVAGWSAKAPERVLLEDLKKRLLAGQDVNWGLLEPLLRVPHEPDRYWVFPNDHGTHVAGILAADWRRSEEEGGEAEDLIGLCPDLRLYDIRVLPRGAGSEDDEFNVIAALQFVRYLNSQKRTRVIQGANLSLSIPHEVANYACGRTPVCEECERLVSSGVVVVAAAGNLGYQRFNTAEGELEGYHTISITDPGNAEGVITVGATHRNRPHSYGVSYFSSRGPTGDGRAKPDLVAPGEKITAPVPGDDEREKDGTSMAAPHVSGAAAMLMARHNELVGQPARIKQILTRTATDLGRERYFQGAGMLDILRALQSM